MTRILSLLGPIVALACAAGAQAQTLKSVQVEPATAAPGQAVTATAAFDISTGLNCNVRIHWGDGKTEDVKINQEKDALLARTHVYAQPGAYTIKVEPKTALPVLKCLGPNQTAAVTVAAPQAAAAPAARPAAAHASGSGPACPQGWALDARSVSRKSGAFTCRAKAGTALPEVKPACPGKLRYHEDAKAGRLGCRP